MSQNKMSRCSQCGYEYDSTEHSQCPLCLEKQKEPGIWIRLARLLIGLPWNVKVGMMGMSLINIFFASHYMWKSMILNILSTMVYGLFLITWYRLKDKLELRLWFSVMLFIGYVPFIFLIVVLYRQ